MAHLAVEVFDVNEKVCFVSRLFHTAACWWKDTNPLAALSLSFVGAVALKYSAQLRHISCQVETCAREVDVTY